MLRYKKRGPKTNKDIIPFGKQLCELIKKDFKNQQPNSRGIKGKGLFSNDIAKTSLLLQQKKKTRLSHYQLNLFIEKYQKKVNLNTECISCSDNHYFYDKIEKIEFFKEETEMFDIEVEKDHSFIANGFICHNSQGQEYPTVIILMINQHGSKILQRNLLYTALTRAKKKIVIITLDQPLSAVF